MRQIKKSHNLHENSLFSQPLSHPLLNGSFGGNRELKQTDAAVERRRSHSNLHSIESNLCQGPSKFTWPLSPSE